VFCDVKLIKNNEREARAFIAPEEQNTYRNIW